MNAKCVASAARPAPGARHCLPLFAALLAPLSLLPATAQNATVKVVATPPTAAANPAYTANRAPLMPSPFIKLPIGSIVPRGWLRHQLELEAEGMTGRLEEISEWCKFQNSAWASAEGQGKFGWEELPYWLKGFGDLGYVLKDERITKEARRWIDAAFASQEADGYFGPRANKTGLDGHPDLWPHMVMLNVMQSFFEATGDARVIPFMTRYLKWLAAQPPATFGRGYWPKLRFGDTVESSYWLYNRTGETWLLDLARKIHENMARWDSGVINWHNVNLAQGFREPGVYYLQSHDPKHLGGAVSNYETVMGLYGQFPGGGFAGDENCRPGYNDPRQGFETCGIVEFMHSFEMLTKISADPVWADRCEELAFNSLPASMTADAKALHYLTCANQVQLDEKNKAPAIQNGGTMFSYSPYGVYRCCQHNVSHGWPYYAEELWLATPDRGLCASLYAACEVTANAGENATVTISEETRYPFDGAVELKVSPTAPTRFPLYLRIPRWCSAPTAEINGQPVALGARPSAYAVIEREWKAGDRLSLRLPMQVTVRTWEKNKNAVSVDYGPLTFSLKIGERSVRYGGTDAWPELAVYATTPWNYGLVLDEKDPAKSFEVVKRAGEVAGQPFTLDTAPIELRAKARKIAGWKQDAQGLISKLQLSPIKSEEPVETVTLIPMGAARLRITAFPVIGSGADAHEWSTPKAPPVSASHCFDGDTVEAMIDGLEPKSSGDHSLPRFTWWDHRGRTEWVQYAFEKPRRVAGTQIYWFDDTGVGQCRLPKSWKVMYKDGDTWKPVVATGEYQVSKDAYNRIDFTPVQTTALRVEVQLQPKFSGGILEWKVIE